MNGKQTAFIGGHLVDVGDFDLDAPPHGLRAAINAKLSDYRDSLQLFIDQDEERLLNGKVPGYRRDHDEGVIEGMKRAMRLWQRTLGKP